MKARAWFGALRLLMAAVCLAALVSRFLWGLGSATFTPGNFFAYLTVQSSILFVVVSGIAAIVAFRGENDSGWLDLARASVLGSTLSCGIIFALIIEQSGARGFRIDVPWSDVALHFVLPAFALLDWLVGPGRGRAPWRCVPIVLAFMAGWAVVTLIRGPIVGWYPYFFLDPGQLENSGQLLLFATAAIVFFGGITAGLVAVSRTRPLAERWADRAELTPRRRGRGRPSRLSPGRRR